MLRCDGTMSTFIICVRKEPWGELAMLRYALTGLRHPRQPHNYPDCLFLLDKQGSSCDQLFIESAKK
jgi:hypothetical protein